VAHDTEIVSGQCTDDDQRCDAYVYAADRKSERAEAHLGNFAGILQVDGYGGYAALAKRRQQISLAFCWAHARRKFYELADTSPVATEVLRRIALLYAVEDEVRGSSAEQRRLVRGERSRIIAADLRQYLEARSRQVSAKSKLGEAIRYTLTRWDGLSRFLDDGRIDLDNNAVERSIRPLTKRVPLCTPSSSVCKHWKRSRVIVATRATFPDRRRFDGRRGQVNRADLIRRSTNDLLSGKHLGFDEVAYHVIGDA
jgi:transposase